MASRLLLVAATAVLAGALAVASAPARPSGIAVISPKDRTSVPAGHGVTFTLRVRGTDKVFIHISKSRRKRSDGTIARDAGIGQARRRGSRYTYRARSFDYPEFWLNRRGTYYWQAFRVRCRTARDCRQEGPVTRIRVRG